MKRVVLCALMGAFVGLWPSNAHSEPPAEVAVQWKRMLELLETSAKQLQAKADEIRQRAAKLVDSGSDKATILAVQKTASTVSKFAAAQQDKLGGLNGTVPEVSEMLKQSNEIAEEIDAKEKELTDAERLLEKVTPTTGVSIVTELLESRCHTAICFNRDDRGDGRYWLGIEPLVELPIGKSFALGSGSLASYVNNHDLRIDLAAGLRLWFFRDAISLSVYLSAPLSRGPVRVEGSSTIYPASAVRRPYPGVAVGLFYDTMWIAFDRDELRNGDGSDKSAYGPDFPANSLISSTWTVTFALQPVTSFRTGIGLAHKKGGSQ